MTALLAGPFGYAQDKEILSVVARIGVKMQDDLLAKRSDFKVAVFKNIYTQGDFKKRVSAGLRDKRNLPDIMNYVHGFIKTAGDETGIKFLSSIFPSLNEYQYAFLLIASDEELQAMANIYARDIK